MPKTQYATPVITAPANCFFDALNADEATPCVVSNITNKLKISHAA